MSPNKLTQICRQARTSGIELQQNAHLAFQILAVSNVLHVASNLLVIAAKEVVGEVASPVSDRPAERMCFVVAPQLFYPPLMYTSDCQGYLDDARFA